MGCIHPYTAYVSIDKINDEKKVVLWKNNELEKIQNGYSEEEINSIWKDNTGNIYRKTLIPCNKCTECRLEYSKNLAKRIEIESLKYDKYKNWFVTITYNNANMKIIEHNGALYGNLCKKDTQRFIHNLRQIHQRNYQEQIEFALAGEYGGQTYRPHYHSILLNTTIKKLEICGTSEMGGTLYRSKELEDIWKMGDIKIMQATPENIAYMCRYTIKKAKETPPEFLQKPFVSMSRNLGKDFYINNKNRILEDQKISIHGRKIIMPKEYIKYVEKESEEKAEEIKIQRRKETKKEIERQQKIYENKSLQEIRDIKNEYRKLTDKSDKKTI